MNDNPFDRPGAAERYAAGRPDFHARVIKRVGRRVAPHGRLDRALDIACGTGQSTRALRSLAEYVIGVDAAPGMLAAAPSLAGTGYAAARAEALPFADASFELANVALALHWFDRRRFLAEASRVLRPGGHLVIYDSGFRGEMVGQPRFGDWVQAYYARYPRPPRAGGEISHKQAARARLALQHRESFAHDLIMTREDFVAYLTSQSNAIAATARGETFDTIAAWIHDSVDDFFVGEPRTLRFSGRIHCFRRR